MISRGETLFVTHCSGQKNGSGDPLTLYTSQRVHRFGNACMSAGVPWAIVSAKHAIFLRSERHDPYDTELSFSGGDCLVFEGGHLLPDADGEAHVKRLVDAIRTRLNDLGIRRVVFYVGGAPQRVCGYLLVLHRALDMCASKHRRPNDLLECIEHAGKVCVANGMAGLQPELEKHQAGSRQ